MQLVWTEEMDNPQLTYWIELYVDIFNTSKDCLLVLYFFLLKHFVPQYTRLTPANMTQKLHDTSNKRAAKTFNKYPKALASVLP